MTLTIDQIMQILGNEIMWCEENPDKALSADYRKGFINGLIQARYLIAEGDKALAADRDGRDEGAR